jgi:hypothetical protein
MLRAIAALMTVLALGLHFGLTARNREAAAAASDEFRRVREEKREVAQGLARKLRLEDARRRTGRLVPSESGVTPARAARLQVVRSLQGSGLSRVRLGVTPSARPPVAVSVRLTGEGSFEEVVRLAGDVARPGSGLLFQKVGLQTSDDRVGLLLQAAGLGQ